MAATSPGFGCGCSAPGIDQVQVGAPAPRPPAAPYLPPAAIVYLTGPTGATGATGSLSIYQEALEITALNEIPPLTKPWKAGPGAFANIIIGAATLINGLGAVTFSDGLTAVAFNPALATFNLDPGDVVIAQYSTA